MRPIGPALKFPLCLSLLISLSTMACSTPVFRYALEHWEPDTYILEARLPAQPSDEIKAVLAELQGREDLNVAVRELPAGDEPPSFTLRYPHAPPTHPAVLTLPVTKDNVALIAESPARAEVSKRLLAGETAVFLFLESGDAEKDKTVLERLERIIGDLEKNLELPAQAPADTLVEGETPNNELKIDFSVVRVKLDDPKEKVLVEALLGSEPDLRDLKGPMAFPVFGRGRSLYAIVDKGINAEVLYEAGAFMTGACSCQVKAQNPGVDLPMAAAWDSIPKDAVYEEVELPPLTSIQIGEGGEVKETTDTPEEAMEPSVESQPTPEESTAAKRDRSAAKVMPGTLMLFLPMLVILGSIVLISQRQKK